MSIAVSEGSSPEGRRTLQKIAKDILDCQVCFKGVGNQVVRHSFGEWADIKVSEGLMPSLDNPPLADDNKIVVLPNSLTYEFEYLNKLTRLLDALRDLAKGKTVLLDNDKKVVIESVALLDEMIAQEENTARKFADKKDHGGDSTGNDYKTIYSIQSDVIENLEMKVKPLFGELAKKIGPKEIASEILTDDLGDGHTFGKFLGKTSNSRLSRTDQAELYGRGDHVENAGQLLGALDRVSSGGNLTEPDRLRLSGALTVHAGEVRYAKKRPDVAEGTVKNLSRRVPALFEDFSEEAQIPLTPYRERG